MPLSFEAVEQCKYAQATVREGMLSCRRIYQGPILQWPWLIPAGQHVVVSTSTASGKSLCYNLPVIEALASNRNASAIYVFPTKALAQDQLRALREFLSAAFPHDTPMADVYDGDTDHVRPSVSYTVQYTVHTWLATSAASYVSVGCFDRNCYLYTI